MVLTSRYVVDSVTWVQTSGNYATGGIFEGKDLTLAKNLDEWKIMIATQLPTLATQLTLWYRGDMGSSSIATACSLNTNTTIPSLGELSLFLPT